ncbi:MAG: P-II family nitrogen regulator [Trueperaceae bacterium]|nr:P-II family nitrogen regulator [Trueperaceae bacterium]
MKLIIAIVRPERLQAVKEALFSAGIRGITLTHAAGHGGQGGVRDTYRGSPYVVEFRKKVRIEIAVTDAYVQPALDAVVRAAKTGDVGDGKIFVQTLERVIRIRTGEEDAEALTPVERAPA